MICICSFRLLSATSTAGQSNPVRVLFAGELQELRASTSPLGPQELLKGCIHESNHASRRTTACLVGDCDVKLNYITAHAEVDEHAHGVHIV